MAQNRCPLCGGRVMKGECIGCGYRLPDEEKLSAPYNLDPEDDRPESFEPSPEKYEMPGVGAGTAERYGAVPVKEKTAQNAPNIKVVPTQNNTPAPQNTPQQGWQNPYGNSSAKRNAPQQNTPQNTPQQGWQNPYNYNPAQRQNRNPVNGTSSPLSQKAMIATLIVLLVLTLFTPMFGVIGLVLNGSFGTNLGAGTKKLFTILFIVALWASFLIKI